MKEFDDVTLDLVPLLESCTVKNINSKDNPQIRRMYDLGIVHGTRITPLYKSMFGDTVAYLIKGSVIAIRKSDANRITVNI